MNVNTTNSTLNNQQTYNFPGSESIKNVCKTVIPIAVDLASHAAMFQVAKPYFAGEDDAENFRKLTCQMMLGNLFFRTVQKLEFIKKTTPIDSELCDLGATIGFSYLYEYTVGVLGHEYGHYYAIKYFDESSSPTINLTSNGGSINYSPFKSTFEYIKYRIGYETPASIQNDVVITAGGPAADLAQVTALIALAHFLKSRPTISTRLNITAIIHCAVIASYALSALAYPTSNSHDFAVLWNKANIHPCVAALGIIGTPLLVKWTLNLGDHCWKYLRNNK